MERFTGHAEFCGGWTEGWFGVRILERNDSHCAMSILCGVATRFTQRRRPVVGGPACHPNDEDLSSGARLATPTTKTCRRGPGLLVRSSRIQAGLRFEGSTHNAMNLRSELTTQSFCEAAPIHCADVTHAASHGALEDACHIRVWAVMLRSVGMAQIKHRRRKRNYRALRVSQHLVHHAVASDGCEG